MPLNLAQKLVRSHLAACSVMPGEEIGLTVDQALLQDVLGTLVMLGGWALLLIVFNTTLPGV